VSHLVSDVRPAMVSCYPFKFATERSFVLVIFWLYFDFFENMIENIVFGVDYLSELQFDIRLFDKVKYNDQECFVFGRRVSGSFDVRLLDGTTLNAGISYKKVKVLEQRKTILIERRKAIPPVPSESP